MARRTQWAIWFAPLMLLSVQVLAVAEPPLLQALQQELDRLRTSVSMLPVRLSPVPDVSPLIGVKREQVVSRLGEPDSAETEEVYWFYRLPPGWLGGGPELVLRYAEDRRVVSAVWRFSR